MTAPGDPPPPSIDMAAAQDAEVEENRSDGTASPDAGSPKRQQYARKQGGVRRPPVMGESITSMDIEFYEKPFFPKDEASKESLKMLLSNNQRWQVMCNADVSTMDDIVNAFAEIICEHGHQLITQGDEGDCLYVCQEGDVDVYVARPGPDGQVDIGNPGPKVATLGAGSLFGELALLYSAPRAATVVVSSPSCRLWTLDRTAFKMLLAQHGEEKYQKYEGWLQNVDILQTLNHFELSQLSEAMDSVLYETGDVIIKEGDPGDSFYLLEEGTCAAFINGEAGEVQVKAYTMQGEYFGEIALMQDTARKATVRAATDCVVASLSREPFTALLGPLQDILQDRVKAYPTYESFTS